MQTRHIGPGRNSTAWTLACVLAACGGIATSMAHAQQPPPNVVETDKGLIEGTIESDRISFKGIPYAKAPVGALRWKPPQAMPGWDGVRPATQFGNDCMQEPAFLNPNTVGMSEDCLFLNVYQPLDAKPGDKRPVHVWIHGGGWSFGAGSDPIFDNHGDTSDGIVYVNLNYRLNAFGFLAHPGLTAESPHQASGNYGLMDQIAALKWVRSNIAEFGGDPDKVTVSGESAGAGSIGYLIASPRARGLFQRVILQSTFAFHPQKTLAQSEQWAVERFGTDLAAMRALSAEAVYAVHGFGGGIETDAAIYGYQDWAPTIDGWVVPKTDRQAWADGDFATVDMMIGDNENEGLLFMFIRGPLLTPEQLTVPHFQARLASTYPENPHEALAVYPVAQDADVLEQLALAYGDAWFQNASRELSRYMVTRTPNVYRYLFTKHSAQPFMIGSTPIATHGDEFPYMFGAIAEGPKYAASDIATSIAMQEAKRRFIRTGNPNGGGLVWPAYDATDPYLEFGDAGQTTGAGRRNRALDLVNDHMEVIEPLD